ncbi:hypothetical protein ABEO93_20380 [Bacillus atrophaeus]|uniref:hypothetical protein n=1 Tax=Bacillus atrophaeus TaxID=1452 RepID=UPI00077A8449|nr:hypothetical protein AXI57_16070 [Bacillus atrophaeus]
MAGQKQKRRLKKDLIMPAAAGIRFAEMRPGLTGAFLLLLNFRPRSLVKKWPGTMQLLLQDPPEAIRKLTDACYRAF